MEEFTKFWSGLGFLASQIFKLFIILIVILFILIFVNSLLKRFNFSWSQKYVKKIEEIISSASGLKSIIQSFEKLINIFFKSVSIIIDAFALFIRVTFSSIDKLVLTPVNVLLNKIDYWFKKFEKTMNDSDKNSDERNGDKTIEKSNEQQNIKEKDEILDSIFNNKTKREE